VWLPIAEVFCFLSKKRNPCFFSLKKGKKRGFETKETKAKMHGDSKMKGVQKKSKKIPRPSADPKANRARYN